MTCVVVLSMVEQAAKPLPRPVRVSSFPMFIPQCWSDIC